LTSTDAGVYSDREDRATHFAAQNYGFPRYH
jgi:hypothetical protein